VAGFDAVLLLTRHAAMDLKPVAEAARLIVDTRNAFAAFGLPPERWVKA
jgi:UDP-N-acetyl-D-mannosaminuronate dehydrogenase